MALDTSVIVPALLSWHEHHPLALPAVQEALESAERAVLPLPALVESYAVMTRLPAPEIDNALNCPVGSSSCVRVDIIVRVQAGSDCGVFEVLDGAGPAAVTLAGPFNAAVDGAGNFSGQVPSLALVIPYSTGSGAVDINIHLTGVIITGTLGTNALTNVVLGGTLLRADFETTIQNLVPLFGGIIEFEDIAPILANLYDVQVGGMCAGLSTGFLASGPRLP